MDEYINYFDKNLNLKKDEMKNSKSGNSFEENLVKDLEESLKNTVEETLDTLNSLIDIVKTKIEDPSVVDNAEKIVDSINKEISNSYTKSINQLSSIFKESEAITSFEEE
jgi:hypothetical protein